ncbi:menaquinone-dependent protoporphyrinogen IX dehydrogenase [Shewanella sp. HL-SH8]|uniref:menaquinone-dependent protoporphyrinogen IX dehydrogenase n=1 Tax=unclassified Shewanella TaxID=196818 RepID=UPI003EBA4146
MQSLLVYSTVDGQTLAICQRIKQQLEQSGHGVTLKDVAQVSQVDIESASQIIIGASIRYGKHRPALYDFIASNKAAIESKANSFFTVNVVARKPEKNTPATNPYMQKFLLLSQWQPQLSSVFAGKIDYPKYGFVDKFMIRFIMWMTKGPTDTSATFEFTDWNKVDDFAAQLVQQA